MRQHLRCNLLFGVIGHFGLLKDVISFFLSSQKIEVPNNFINLSVACDHWMFRNRQQIFIQDHALNNVDSLRYRDQRHGRSYGQVFLTPIDIFGSLNIGLSKQLGGSPHWPFLACL